MSNRPVDEQIVRMRLDNSDFVKKAAETTSIFGKLKQAFSKAPPSNLGQTTKDLNNVNKAIDQINVGRVAQSLDVLTGKISTLGIAGATMLANITNKATNAGLAIANSLTVAPISQGFQEYETKIGAIGTMLANTEWYGATLEDVKGTLEELNVYADNTVYSFSQMTENIGRFTAAGVKLDDASIAIKGMSNLAAASGSDVNQLNTAMYQMSQAMAAGKMNLMDWNSLVNAGMAGKKTQDALVATAKAMGKTVDLTDGFRNSISDGWLTSEIFLETMKKFGNDPAMTEAATAVRTFTGMMDSLKETIGSGWATTWELIFGDFEEATDFWTKISTSLGDFMTGFTKSRNDLLKGVKDAGGIQNVFDGIANVLSFVGDVLGAVKKGFREIFPPATVASVMKLTEGFKSFTEGLSLGKGELDSISTIAKGVFSIFDTAVTIAKQLGGVFVKLIPPQLGGGLLTLLENIAKLAIGFNESVHEGNFLTGLIDILGGGFEFLGSVIGGIVDGTQSVGDSIRNNIGPAIEWLSEAFAPLKTAFTDAFSEFGGTDVLGATAVGGISVVVLSIVRLIKNLKDMFTGKGDNWLAGIKDTLEGVTNSIQSFTTSIKITSLVLIAGALMMVAVSLKLLEDIKVEDLAAGLTALTVSLGAMVGALAIISKFSLGGDFKAVGVIIGLAVAVSIIATALKKLSDIKPGEMLVAVGGLVAVVATLTGALALMSKIKDKVAVGSLQLVALATSVLILTKAVKSLSEIKSTSLGKALLALTAIFAQVALFALAMKKTPLSVTSAAGMLIVASALVVMSKAVKSLSTMNTDELIRGLSAMAVILAEIAIFSKVAGGPSLLVGAAGVLLIATALQVMVGPIQTLSKMSLTELGLGLGAMAVALAAVVAAAYAASGALSGAVAITALSVALNLLVIPIQAMAGLGIGGVALGIGAIAAAIVILAAASMALSPAVVPMLGFAAALLAIGAAVGLVGLGIGAFGLGIAALSTLTLTSVASIVASLALLLSGLQALIPGIVAFVVNLAIALVGGIKDLVPVLIDAIMEIIDSLLTELADHLPRFIDSGIDIVLALIEGIGEGYPQLIDAAYEMIVDVINGMADALENNSAELVSAVMRLVGEILIVVVEAGTQIISAFFGWIPGVNEAMDSVSSSATEYIRNNFGAEGLGEEKGAEFAGGLSSTSGDAEGAGETLSGNALSGLKSADATGAGNSFGSGFVSGIQNKGLLDRAISAASSLAQSALGAINKVLDINSPSKATMKSGVSTSEGYAKGIDKSAGMAVKSAKNATEKVRAVFDKRMDNLELKLRDGDIDARSYIKSVESMKKAYSKYADIVRDANEKILSQEKAIIENRKFYGTMNLKQELAAYNKLNKQFKKGSQEQLEVAREIHRLKQEIADKEFEDAKKKMDEKKYYNQLSLEEELASWRALYQGMNKSTDEAKEAAREIYRLKNEIRQKELDDFKKDLETKRYYNNLSLAQELKAWNAQAKKYKEGTEERIEADREVYRLKNEIYKRTIEINEDYTNKILDADQRMIDSIKQVNDERQNRITSLADSFIGFAGIFDEVAEKSEVSGEQLLKNLSGQVETISEWSNNIRQLTARGVDEELVRTLGEMGPAAAAEIAALNTLTDSQLTEYANLWKTKNSLARNEAAQQLDYMNKDSDAAIEEIRKNTQKELEEYQKDWEKALRGISEVAEEEFVDLEDNMRDVGRDVVNGLIKGLEDISPDLIKKASKMAEDIAKTINKVLDINSPSGVTMESGKEVVNGVVEGIKSKLASVDTTTKSIGQHIKDSMESVASDVELDNTVHISAMVSYIETNKPDFSSISMPDNSYSRSIKQSLVPQATVAQETQTSNATNGDSKKYNQFIEAVKAMASKPTVTKLELDGREVAEVVSRHQYDETTLALLRQ